MLPGDPAMVPVPKRECLVDNHISPEIRKVRRFGGIARGFCVAFGIYCAVVLVAVALMIAFGSAFQFNFMAFSLRTDEFTPFLTGWAAVFLISLVIPGCIGLRHMYRLFNNLREGRIYTRENVRHIRMLGILGIVLPIVLWGLLTISLLISKAGLTPPGAVPNTGQLFFGPTSLSVFIWPSLLILASWIMENGRQVQDDAARMRRDAELTI
jgi:hypothetical protein